MKCLLLGQMSQLESLRALYQGLYFLLYASAIFPKLFILAKELPFMQSTVNVLESSTLLAPDLVTTRAGLSAGLSANLSKDGFLERLFYFPNKLLLL